MDDAYRKRAEARRQRMSGGVATSEEELVERDIDFWLAVEPAKRIGAVRVLLEELRALRNDGPLPRLQGSAGGVRRREG